MLKLCFPIWIWPWICLYKVFFFPLESIHFLSLLTSLSIVSPSIKGGKGRILDASVLYLRHPKTILKSGHWYWADRRQHCGKKASSTWSSPREIVAMLLTIFTILPPTLLSKIGVKTPYVCCFYTEDMVYFCHHTCPVSAPEDTRGGGHIPFSIRSLNLQN